MIAEKGQYMVKIKEKTVKEQMTENTANSGLARKEEYPA
jgi:hypothetical protein